MVADVHTTSLRSDIRRENWAQKGEEKKCVSLCVYVQGEMEVEEINTASGKVSGQMENGRKGEKEKKCLVRAEQLNLNVRIYLN